MQNETKQYFIFQPKETEKMRKRSFLSISSMKRLDLIQGTGDILPEDYNFIYSGNLSDIPGKTTNAVLENINFRFNINHPIDFKGHSLSVGDIVVLAENGMKGAWFVDSIGFKELPEFTNVLNSAPEKYLSDPQDAAGLSWQEEERAI